MSYRNLSEVLADLQEGLLVSGMLPTALMDFVDESNVDEVIEALPPQHRDYVLDWAQGTVFTPEDELINLAGVSNLREIRPEDKHKPRRAIFFQAMRSWFGSHPWPPRTEI